MITSVLEMRLRLLQRLLQHLLGGAYQAMRRLNTIYAVLAVHIFLIYTPNVFDCSISLLFTKSIYYSLVIGPTQSGSI